MRWLTTKIYIFFFFSGLFTFGIKKRVTSLKSQLHDGEAGKPQA